MEYDYDGYGHDLETEPEYLYADDDENEDGVGFGSNMTLDQLFLLCVKPTLTQTVNSLLFLFVWNLIFRLNISIRVIPSVLQHTFSLICGLCALQSVFPTSFLFLVVLPIFSYLPLLLPSHRGGCLLTLSGVFLMCCELLWLEPRFWHQIRGPQMILIMKAVSLGFDLDIGTVRSVPNFLQYSGYLFCPGNCVFGPWTSYLDYLSIYDSPIVWRFSWYKPYWIGQMLLSAVCSLIFLILSTCFSHFMFSDTSWKWIAAYRDALSFRFSHYFVSFLSETTLLLSGYKKTCLEEVVVVSRPGQIEIPRSLIQVVVSWNLPMHSWLKIYVFNTTRRFGNFLAVLCTYTISALLHGLNFQLAAVLLSLGFYSYVEFMLRKKLAQIFSACIQAKPCKEDCNHQYRWQNPSVVATNLFFGLLAVVHLAYLGVMFDSNESSEWGYSYRHTLTKWSDLDFFSHWLALFSYAIYFLI